MVAQQPPRNLRIEEIREAGAPWFRQVFDLYEQEFQQGERETLESIGQWLRRKNGGQLQPNDFHLLAAVDSEAETLAGFASFHYLAEIQSGFLGYLAVCPHRRNQGIGSFLFGEVKRVIAANAARVGPGPPLGIFMELRKEDRNNSVGAQRRRFWCRLGARPLNFDWRYPRLQAEAGPSEMDLAFCPMRGKETFSEQEMAQCVRAIYRCVYQKNEDDQDLALVLASIRGKGVIAREVSP